MLVGFETSDDAGVYKLTEECALVQTVDFFTPIVDDPHAFGGIAAANALSDVYAMGGRPLTAMAVLAYPASGDLEVLEKLMRGGAEKIHEAGCSLVGGHSINEEDVKFGYSVTGTVHPGKVWTNAGARVGDVLVLTKALGTGVIGTAVKRGMAEEADARAAEESMLQLNKGAAEAMAGLEVHGCTDVTGFGLLGHAREMGLASGVTLEIDVEAVRFLPGAERYAAMGAVPGGTRNNQEFIGECVEGRSAVDDLLYDPQTSGGLLAALGKHDAAVLVERCGSAFVVGSVVEKGRRPVRLEGRKR